MQHPLSSGRYGRSLAAQADRPRTVLKDLDIVREAGGRNRPLVREFHGIQAGPQITIDLVPRAPAGATKEEPVISGVEILEEGTGLDSSKLGGED